MDDKAKVLSILNSRPELLNSLVNQETTREINQLFEDNPVFCAIALTYNEFIWEDIVKAYDSIPSIYEYYLSHKTDVMENVIAAYRINKQEYMIKVMALYFYCEEIGDNALLLKLFKRAHKKLYKNLSTLPQVLDIHVDMHIEYNYPLTERNDLLIYCAEISGYYMAKYLNIPFYATTDSLYRWADYIVQVAIMRVSGEIKISDIENGKPLLEYLKTNYGIAADFHTLDMIIAEYRHKVILESYDKSDAEIYYMQIVEQMHNHDKLLEVYNFMLSLLKSNGIDAVDFTNKPINKEEIKELLLYTVLYVTRNHDLNPYSELLEQENLVFIPIALLFSALIKEYKQASQLHLKLGIEENYLKAKELKQAVEKQYIELESKEKAYKDELENVTSQYTNRIKSFETETLELAKQVKELQKQLEEEKENAKELQALREYAYHRTSIEDEDTTFPSYESLVEYLNEKNITILGGNPKWQLKLKEILPSCNIIAFEDITKNWNLVRKLDCIFLNVNYFNHPTYYKLMNKLSQTSIKVFYVSGYSNIQRTLEELYLCLNS